ncbi:MAG: di-/tricarboxylate transporter [Firmicutes bacterium]|nr:di-/tricarboxylate transporter [Bacillota bacterium]
MMFYVHCAIGLVIMFGFSMMAPIKPVTPVGMQVLGIFLGMIYLWSFVGILWPSLFGILALGLSDYAPMPVILRKSLGDVIPILVFFAMILFGAIQHYGVTKYISRWFLTRKIINGRPVMFSFIFIYTTYVLAALSANVLPALLFMWSILYGVLEDVGYKKGDKYTSVMVIGTMFGAISGQAAKPFVGSALMILASFEKVSKTQLDYLPYMLFGVIMATLAIVIYALLIKFVFKPDMSKIANINTERFEKEKLPPMDLRQKIFFGCLFGYLGLVLLPSILPKTIWLVALLNKLGPWGVVIAFVVALTLFKINGKPIMDFKEIAGRYVIWEVYFLIAMAMVISDALVENSTGIKPFLTETLSPLLGGRSPAMFAVIFVAISMMITQAANNGVMGVLFMPIVYAFSMENGSNPAAIATVMTFALHVAILTPAASPYAAVLYANRDWVDGQDIARYGTVIFVSMMALYLLVGIPLSNMIFR